jgi:7-cyano-7-deazaguanine synthase
MDAVLLSGGMDSISLAAWLRPGAAITIDYGQACAAAEICAAQHISGLMGIQHHTIHADCSSFGSGDLCGAASLPCAPASDWWPFRNQLLITLAAMYAVRLGVHRLLLGTVRSDSFHIDGTPQFIEALDQVVRMQEGAISVVAPAISMTTVELIRKSGVDLSLLCWAHSCHTNNFACGFCRGCFKHREVMGALGHEPY